MTSSKRSLTEDFINGVMLKNVQTLIPEGQSPVHVLFNVFRPVLNETGGRGDVKEGGMRAV